MRSFSDHCTLLGCPLKSVRWSWSALAPNGARALFTIWDDERVPAPMVRGKWKYVLFPPRYRRPGEIPDEADEKDGAREMRDIAARCVADSTIDAFGIICQAVDTSAGTRARKGFDGSTVFRVSVVEEDGVYYALPTDRIQVSALWIPSRTQ